MGIPVVGESPWVQISSLDDEHLTSEMENSYGFLNKLAKDISSMMPSEQELDRSLALRVTHTITHLSSKNFKFPKIHLDKFYKALVRARILSKEEADEIKSTQEGRDLSFDEAYQDDDKKALSALIAEGIKIPPDFKDFQKLLRLLCTDINKNDHVKHALVDLVQRGMKIESDIPNPPQVFLTLCMYGDHTNEHVRNALHVLLSSSVDIEETDPTTKLHGLEFLIRNGCNIAQLLNKIPEQTRKQYVVNYLCHNLSIHEIFIYTFDYSIFKEFPLDNGALIMMFSLPLLQKKLVEDTSCEFLQNEVLIAFVQFINKDLASAFVTLFDTKLNGVQQQDFLNALGNLEKLQIFLIAYLKSHRTFTDELLKFYKDVCDIASRINEIGPFKSLTKEVLFARVTDQAKPTFYRAQALLCLFENHYDWCIQNGVFQQLLFVTNPLAHEIAKKIEKGRIFLQFFELFFQELKSKYEYLESIPPTRFNQEYHKQIDPIIKILKKIFGNKINVSIIEKFEQQLHKLKKFQTEFLEKIAQMEKDHRKKSGKSEPSPTNYQDVDLQVETAKWKALGKAIDNICAKTNEEIEKIPEFDWQLIFDKFFVKFNPESHKEAYKEAPLLPLQPSEPKFSPSNDPHEIIRQEAEMDLWKETNKKWLIKDKDRRDFLETWKPNIEKDLNAYLEEEFKEINSIADLMKILHDDDLPPFIGFTFQTYKPKSLTDRQFTITDQ